jgi:hypothetical protein
MQVFIVLSDELQGYMFRTLGGHLQAIKMHTSKIRQLLYQQNALLFIIKSTKYYNLYFYLCILSPYMFQTAWVIFRGRNVSA